MRVHVAYGYGLFTGGLGAHYGAEMLGCTVIPVSGGQTERQVRLIVDFSPDVIMVTPSYMLAILDEFRRQGIDPRSTSLKIGVFGAEPWTEAMRAEIETSFGIEAIDIYGLSEVMGPGVASECRESKGGPTIWEDHFYPEIVDPASGRSLPDGEVGELVLTSLTREAMPVVRYRTRDLTRLLPGVGRVMRRMAKIVGRSDDMLIGRVAGFHFFNPVPLMKVVEVIAGVRTDQTTVEGLCDLASQMGHRPIRVADSPGFLVNHAGRALATEGLRIVQEGIATVADIDRVMCEAAGFPMGPFELFDLTGMDVSAAVLEQIYAQFHHDPRFRPSYLARRQVDAGLFGRKTERGWYRYEDGALCSLAEAPMPAAEPRPVWLGPVRTGDGEWLRKIVEVAGWPVDCAAEPSPSSLCVIAPLGADATTSTVRLRVDPSRTIAIDALSGRGERRTIMPTPVTAPNFREAASALFSADGSRVTVIHDSPGFIAQRIIAMIVNTGCDIAQQKIAAPADIDAAVRLGLGYAKGPLELGDAWGARTILTILEEMYAFYGDPRYRPSPWLRRRALLNVSLQTGDG
ncbi:MAG TPA: 3-hydroxyacyl-CoA dehydrogenase family protein [Gemmataceae bacterium]|nr:3-hydroxyacyl-CoA dehydrogenase family protein [Gemmataceae bacterium]